MSPLRSFSAHVATPQRKALLPTWTRPAPESTLGSRTQDSAANSHGSAPALIDLGT